MITDIESRIIMTVILVGLLGLMLFTGHMSFASATFGLIVGIVTPVSYIATATKGLIENGRN